MTSSDVQGALARSTGSSARSTAPAWSAPRSIRDRDGFGDTAFTSVLATYRRRGVAQAVKAASILAFLDIGINRFSTGGAAANQASLQANQSLGYVLTERWRTYAP